MRAVADTAAAQGIELRIGGVFSTDCIQDGDPELVARLLRHRIRGIEKESAGLYGVAMREGFQALSVLTVSDHLQRDTHMPATQREQGLSRMTALVLDSLLPVAAR
jgi:purine-nucleoside phosphorylase